MSKIKNFYISTLGCRLNQAESQDLEAQLIKSGWDKASNPGDADLIVVNTCVVTKKAERETRKEIRRLRRENPRARLVAAGCWVDKINQFGGIEVAGIDNMISNQGKWKRAKGDVYTSDGVPKGLPPETLARMRCGRGLRGVHCIQVRALIKIQSGCANSCTYCLPTLIRGPSISIPIKDIVSQVNQAVDAGAVEVVLTGQNVSQYNDQGKTWLDLVDRVLSQTDIQLLRLGSINPTLVERPNSNLVERLTTSDGVTQSLLRGETSGQLVNLYQGVGKNRLARHLHLSLQSGSNRILKKMNRNYTTDQFRKVVKNLRQNVDRINITTDVIVGFPGETKEDFQKTLDFCKEMKFGKTHVFRYSPRQGTLAFQKRKEWCRVGSKTKKKRSKMMRRLERELRRQFWESQIGKTAVAKIWGTGKGLTDNYIPIELKLEKSLAAPVVKKVKLSTFIHDRGKITAEL